VDKETGDGEQGKGKRGKGYDARVCVTSRGKGEGVVSLVTRLRGFVLTSTRVQRRQGQGPSHLQLNARQQDNPPHEHETILTFTSAQD
jgi:hypothetical protein